MKKTQAKITLRVGPPKSLHSLAMASVSQMLVRLNKRGVDPEFPWLKKDNNPFRAFPPRILEEILERFKSDTRQFVKKEIFELIYCRRLKTIDLSGMNIRPRDFSRILEIVNATGSDITTFLVKSRVQSWCNERHEFIFKSHFLRNLRPFSELLSTQKSLTYLAVNNICNDDLLEVIGASCPNLVGLEASSPIVTYKGLRRLCINRDQTKQCQNIEIIHLGSSMSADGNLLKGIKFLLKYLPRLRAIRSFQFLVGQALEQLHQESPDLVFALEEIYIYGPSFSGSHISAIAKTCPQLSHVYIHGATKAQLLNLGEMRNLKELCIFDVQDEDGFENGVAPLLKKIGGSLKTLQIDDSRDVDLEVINEYCPRLERLRCCFGDDYKAAFPETGMFDKLECLSLRSYPGYDLNPKQCIEIMSKCANLVHLDMKCCDQFDKNHLKAALSKNPLRNLETINIQSSYLSVVGDVTSCDVFKNL